MVKYIYDLSKLQLGDIILMRNPNDELSRRVMESTRSEYSHAMLYHKRSSYIEADKRVQARNLARLLFDDQSDTCVLRVKSKFLKPYTIDAAVYYARYVVGNPYALMDAVRLENGKTDAFTADTQICTRLVTKAYAFSGLNIVKNVEMCTLQELLESEYVEVHRDFLIEASEFDLNFAATYDVTDDMVKATEKLFDSVKTMGEGKLRSLNALTEYVIEHPEEDELMAKKLKESGFLNVLEIEEEKNRYNYDKDEFMKLYGQASYEAAMDIIQENIGGRYGYEQEYQDLIRKYFVSGGESHFLILLIALYKQIVEQYNKRIRTCYEVMNDPNS